MATSDQLSSMTDAQLRQAFVDAGFKPGPCIPSTRKTLESIYRKMNAGENVAKFFTQTPRAVAPISTTDGGVEEDVPPPVEQGRLSVGAAPRTPYSDSSILQHPPVNTSTPTPLFAGSKTYETSSVIGVTANENLNPIPPQIIKSGKPSSNIETLAAQKISMTTTSSTTAFYGTLESSQLQFPSQSAVFKEMTRTSTSGPTATPIGRIHYPEKEAKVDYFSSQSRPEVVVKTTTSSYYGNTGSARPYTTSSGSFNPSLITPREPVKNTPVSTGGFDLRQRKGPTGSPVNVANAGGASAQKGGSNALLIVVFSVIIAAIVYYFLFLSGSSRDDGDVGIPKISGDAPVGDY